MNEVEKCQFCRGEFEHTVIERYDNWALQLYENQYYLGRCLIKLDRHAVDVTEMKKEERRELFDKILPELRSALNQSFSPDLYNYSSLGNDCRHLHFHIIPRYESTRKFEGKKFKDENWNSHYKPYPKDFKLAEETFSRIKKEIGDQL